MRKAAILQSAYLPWRGYFDLMAYVDEFIIYDDVQISKNSDWRNRNRIQASDRVLWITIPLSPKFRHGSLIEEVIISDQSSLINHLNMISRAYEKSQFFVEVLGLLTRVYEKKHTNLSQLNVDLLAEICRYLGITTRITRSSDYGISGSKSGRLALLTQAADCTCYVSGPAAQAYIDEAEFRKRGLTVEWFNYDELNEYPQSSKDFDGSLSIIDLLFNCGPDSRSFLPSLAKG